jgi:hypothetical protein
MWQVAIELDFRKTSEHYTKYFEVTSKKIEFQSMWNQFRNFDFEFRSEKSGFETSASKYYETRNAEAYWKYLEIYIQNTFLIEF